MSQTLSPIQKAAVAIADTAVERMQTTGCGVEEAVLDASKHLISTTDCSDRLYRNVAADVLDGDIVRPSTGNLRHYVTQLTLSTARSAGIDVD